MCVIVAVKLKKDIPPIDVLQKCDSSNPQGMGYMYVKDGLVHIEKGFWQAPLLMQAMQKDIPDDSPVVIHFRLATHGGQSGNMCHPFPVTNDYAALCALAVQCDIGVAHNGIMHNYGKIDTNYSDTQNFIATVLYHVKDYLGNEGIRKLIMDSIGTDKLAFLDKTGYMRLFGLFHEKDNAWYSNLYWNWSAYTRRGKTVYEYQGDYDKDYTTYPLKVITDRTKESPVWGKKDYTLKDNKKKNVWKYSECWECGAMKTTNEMGLCAICTSHYALLEGKTETETETLIDLAEEIDTKTPNEVALEEIDDYLLREM
jgi:predicted glutamine amidotransferase